MAKKKVKVKVEDLRKYLNFCDAGMLYSHDVWISRCRLMATVEKADLEAEEYLYQVGGA